MSDVGDVGDGGHWLTVQQAAAALDKSSRTVRRWIDSNKLAHRRIGGRVEVDVSEFVELEEDVPALLAEVDILRSEVGSLRALVERQDGEIQFLRSALASALRLQQAAIEQPQERRRWRWRFWETED